MDKILEMLGVAKLDEGVQVEIKDTLSTIIESKATEIAEEKVDGMLSEEKERLVEEMETKFEDYKEDITSKFSNFVDTVLEEELQIPQKVLEYARLGELYHDLVEQFKVRLAIDEGLLDQEVKETIKEAKDEILSLRSELNESTGKNLDLEKDAQEMAAHIYLRKKCDGLTESQKKHVLSIIGDITVKEDIDKKFDIVVESMGVLIEADDEDDDDDKKKKDDDDEDLDEGSSSYECTECGKIAEVKEGDDTKCPECEGKMKKSEKANESDDDDEDEDDDDDKKKDESDDEDGDDDKKKKKKDDDDEDLDEGKGHSEVKGGKLDESKDNKQTPWEHKMSQWKDVVKNGF